MEIQDKTNIYINIDNTDIPMMFDIFGFIHKKNRTQDNLSNIKPATFSYYNIRYNYSKIYQFVNFDHFDNEIECYIKQKRPDSFENIIADPNKVDLYYVYYHVGASEFANLFESTNFQIISKKLQLYLDNRIIADLQSGKAKIIFDHSLEGNYNIYIDKLGEVFLHYGIDPKNVIWLSGDVSLEKNAKGSILDNKSFVYWEGRLVETIGGHVKEKLNLIFEKKKEKIKNYAIDSNSMFTLWQRRPRMGRFNMIYFLKKHNMLNYIAWGLYPSLWFYDYFKFMQQNYKKQGYYIDDKINNIEIQQRRIHSSSPEIPLHIYRELLSYEVMVDIYSNFCKMRHRDLLEHTGAEFLHDITDKQSEDLFFTLTLSDKSSGKANQNPHDIYDNGSSHTFEYEDIENSLIQIVVETYTHTSISRGLGPKIASPEKRLFLSEKSFKPFATNMLPIYAAEPHTVKYLRSIGYDLYDDLLNHDYDKDENDVSRLENVVLECKRLLNKQEEICDFITNNWDRIESNNRHLKNCKYRGGVI